MLVSSGIDMSMYTPHSTRSASTSVAALKIPIDSVLKTAGWKKDCVFRKFYQRDMTNNSEFSNAVFGTITMKILWYMYILIKMCLKLELYRNTFICIRHTYSANLWLNMDTNE